MMIVISSFLLTYFLKKYKIMINNVDIKGDFWMKLFEGRKRRWGDRYDGFLVRNLDPMGKLTPYIMKTRSDSWVLFEQKIDVTATMDFLREQRRGDMKGLTMYELLFAALVRTISQVPQINRFVQNSKVYARNEIKLAMVVKKDMSWDGDRTVITPRFDPDDTLAEVREKIQAEISKITKNVKVEDDENKTGFDILETTLSMVPGILLKFVVGLIFFLDKHGLLPKFVNKLSPFHSTAFITHMGSFGMDAVYHHIYELGTISVFGAIGNRETVYELQKDGSSKKKVYLNVMFVIDERITDGFMYGLAMKEFTMNMAHPERLLKKPEKVVEDIIDKKKK